MKICTAPIMSWNFCKNTADVTLKFELALLSRGEVSTKIRGHSIHSLQNMTCPYITSWNVCKNVLDLMKPLGNLNCRFYQEVTFLQKVRHFCWCSLKIRPAPIITSKNFRQNKAVLMISLKIWSSPLITWNFCKNSLK